MTEETTVQTVSTSEEQEFWFDTFKKQYTELEANVNTFYSNGKKRNQAAGDARKLLQSLRNLAKVGRDHIQATKKLVKK